jgi:hypothetical protein
MSTTAVPGPASAPPGAKLDKVGYLFGQKIAASLSPLLHQTIYDNIGLRWEQHRLDSADIPAFLELAKAPDFYGKHHFNTHCSATPLTDCRELRSLRNDAQQGGHHEILGRSYR